RAPYGRRGSQNDRPLRRPPEHDVRDDVAQGRGRVTVRGLEWPSDTNEIQLSVGVVRALRAAAEAKRDDVWTGGELLDGKRRDLRFLARQSHHAEAPLVDVHVHRSRRDAEGSHADVQAMRGFEEREVEGEPPLVNPRERRARALVNLRGIER